MDGGFAWTIPLIQSCFGVLFLIVHRAGAAAEARYWGWGYLATAAAFAAALAVTVVPERVAAAVTDTLFACAFFSFAQALVRRYHIADRFALRLPLLAVAIGLPLAGTLAGNATLEIVSSDIGCVVQIAVPLLALPRWPAGWADRYMVTLSWLVVVANVLRPLGLIATAGTPGFASLVDTAYGYMLYADGMVNSIAFAGVALVTVTSELLARYRHEATIDPLTGLLNRRGLEVVADRSPRSASDSLILCDLDHFKRVNDTFGHDIGDRVLVAVAGILRDTLPAGARAARIGGEEFAILLPDHTAGAVQGVAVRLHVALARFDWATLGLGWRQSASFGLVTRTGDAVALREMLRLADARLYEAKRSGRDRICADIGRASASARG